MKVIFSLLVVGMFSEIVSAAGTDYFNYFSGAYRVGKRVCPSGDTVCGQIDTVIIVSKQGETSHLLEMSKGKIIEDTSLASYGDNSKSESYATLYGTPDLAGWREEVKNSQNQTVRMNAVAINRTVNSTQEGPVFLYSLGKSSKIYIGSSAKIQNRSYVLTRDPELFR